MTAIPARKVVSCTIALWVGAGLTIAQAYLAFSPENNLNWLSLLGAIFCSHIVADAWRDLSVIIDEQKDHT